MYNLCIIKPNKSAFSETFVQEHIDRLAGNKKILYGGAFPLFDHEGHYLIKSRAQLLLYLIQKRIFKMKDIEVRTKALTQYLKKESINVVFSEFGTVGALVTEACRRAGVPLVVHFHGGDAHQIQTVQEYKHLYLKCFLYASAIIAVSQDMMKSLELLGAPKSKLFYIPCGVDTDKFRSVFLKRESQMFLSIGRFVEKKSPISVLKAFELVLKEVPKAELWMVGNGPLRAEIVAYIERAGLQKQVHLPGVLSQEDIRKLIADARCFVQHSVTAENGDMEGTPLTISEAGASGLPIVSTRHAGIKDAVIDGVTGYLVEEFDIEAMAKGMIEIANSFDLAVKMGAAGRQHIVSNYDIRLQISKLDRLIKNAVETGVEE